MKRMSPARSLLMVLALLCAAVSATLAAPLPRVAVIYANNAKTTYDDALDNCVLKNLDEVLSPKFEVVRSGDVFQKLADRGMTDLAMAERRDIMDALAGDEFDYIICLSVEPFQRKEKFSVFTQGIEMTATVPFKFIDVNGDRYLYNGKVVELQSDSTWVGSVGNKSVAIEALQKVNKGINKVIKEKMIEPKAGK